MNEIKASELQEIITKYPEIDSWYFMIRTDTNINECCLSELLETLKKYGKSNSKIFICNKIDPTFLTNGLEDNWLEMINDIHTEKNTIKTQKINIVSKTKTQKIESINTKIENFTETQKLGLEVIKELIKKHKK